MEILKNFWALLNSIPADVWAIAVQTIMIAITVSPLAQVIKKVIRRYWDWLDDPRRREIVMMLIVMLGSLAGSAFVYLRNDPRFSGWFVVIQGLLAFAVTQPFYIYFLKPLTIRLGLWLTDRITAPNAINEAKAAALPATGLPLEPVVGQEDF